MAHYKLNQKATGRAAPRILPLGARLLRVFLHDYLARCVIASRCPLVGPAYDGVGRRDVPQRVGMTRSPNWRERPEAVIHIDRVDFRKPDVGPDGNVFERLGPPNPETSAPSRSPG